MVYPGISFLIGDLSSLPIFGKSYGRWLEQFWNSVLITTYKHKRDGRMNIVVSQTLGCLLTESGMKDWEQLLAIVEMIINSSPNSNTGYTPFFLNYGFHPVAPIELLFGDEISAVESVQNFVDRIRTLWKTAMENLQKFVVKQARL